MLVFPRRHARIASTVSSNLLLLSIMNSANPSGGGTIDKPCSLSRLQRVSGSRALSEEPLDAVELELTASARELSPALEAAQYARLIQPDDPESEQEAEAIAGFLEAFGACTEAWESCVDARPLALGRLSARIETLETLGLYVHAGSIHARLDEQPGPPLPLAIVTITRSSLPTIRLLLPANLEISNEGGMAH
jgi:hypothetical protein